MVIMFEYLSNLFSEISKYDLTKPVNIMISHNGSRRFIGSYSELDKIVNSTFKDTQFTSIFDQSPIIIYNFLVNFHSYIVNANMNMQSTKSLGATSIDFSGYSKIAETLLDDFKLKVKKTLGNLEKLELISKSKAKLDMHTLNNFWIIIACEKNYFSGCQSIGILTQLSKVMSEIIIFNLLLAKHNQDQSSASKIESDYFLIDKYFSFIDDITHIYKIVHSPTKSLTGDNALVKKLFNKTCSSIQYEALSLDAKYHESCMILTIIKDSLIEIMEEKHRERFQAYLDN